MASPAQGVAGSNIRFDLSRVDVVLHAKFQPRGSNGVAAYSGHTHTDSHLHYIDLLDRNPKAKCLIGDH